MSYNARAEPLFCSLNLLFNDVPVVVAVLVILNSLISIERGENHCKSYHIESVTFKEGDLRGEVHASMKKKVYKVTVSERVIRSIDRE